MNKFISGILLQNIYSQRVWRQRFSLILGICLLAVSGAGQATVISGSSSSYVVSVDVSANVLGLINLNLGVSPTPVSSGTAPDPYVFSNSTVSLNEGLNLLGINLLGVSAGILNADASSDADGSDGAKFASASASIVDLGVGALGLIGLNVEAVKSTASVYGDFGALVAAGETILAGAELSILGVPIALIDIPAPNTVVDLSLAGLVGVSLILNEQIFTGNGIDSIGLVVNAIHLSFNAFVSGAASLTGDIIISHAQAQISTMPGEVAAPAPAPIPEPGTLALLGSGFAILGWKSRRKTAASFA
jgi:hypothetical protein